MQKMMWASASSMVFMVRVDLDKVDERGMRCFRDYIDGHNKHIIRLAEKDVRVGDKRYKYFAMQTTGGGHFPSKHVHPETALNLFKANIIPILNLERDGIEYDIIQVRSRSQLLQANWPLLLLMSPITFHHKCPFQTRSCARGVTAQNAFRMSAPASNMVMVYGLGGIGMSTMAANGLLMRTLMNERAKVATGAVDAKEFKETLTSGRFGADVLPWKRPNPFSQINIAQFMDNVDNPKSLANQMALRPPIASIKADARLSLAGNSQIMPAQRSLLSAFTRFRHLGAATAAASAIGLGWIRSRG